MEKLTIEQLEEKYGNIEDKVPSIFKNYKEVSINMQQDLYDTWDITNAELYRVISVVAQYTNDSVLHKHLDLRFSYLGLYPHVQKTLNVLPEYINKDGSIDVTQTLTNILLEEIRKDRKNGK